MASGKELTPSEYIEHHLTFLTKPVSGDGGFWSINVDSLATATLLGVVGLGIIWWIVRGATSGDRNKFIAPAALTVFVWVVLMNAMDFLPADLVGLATHHVSDHGFRYVPTADVNTTFALSLSVWFLMIGFAVAAKGMGGFIHELFCAPFGANPLLWPANFLFNLVEYVSKPLSHSLRLFGNMYAGEILFLLLWMWAATGLAGTIFGSILGLGWAIFHILIVLLQAYIFMMLTVVYISMAHEHH